MEPWASEPRRRQRSRETSPTRGGGQLPARRGTRPAHLTGEEGAAAQRGWIGDFIAATCHPSYIGAMRFEDLLETVDREPVFETGLLLAGDVDPADVRRQLSRWVRV